MCLVCLFDSPEEMNLIQVAADRDPRHHQGWVMDQLELEIPVVRLDHSLSLSRRDLPVEDTVKTLVILSHVYRLVLNTIRNPLDLRELARTLQL